MAGAAGGGLAGAGGLPVRVSQPCPGPGPRVHGHEADNNPDKTGSGGAGPGRGLRGCWPGGPGGVSMAVGRGGFPAKGRAGWAQAGPGAGRRPPTRR
jgi:hypothetical protein